MDRALVLAVLLVGCGQPPVVTEAPTPPPSVAPPSSVAPPTPREVVVGYDAMLLHDGVLNVCSTMEARYTIPAGVDWNPPEIHPTEGFVVVPTGCDVQFANRVPMGVCTRTSTTTASGNGANPAGVVLSLRSVRRFYALEDDDLMAHCISDGGSWTEGPH